MTGHPERLGAAAERSVATMLDYYGEQTSDWLVNQVHLEEPWREARTGLGPRDRSKSVISLDSMRAFYGPMFADPEITEALATARREQGMTASEIHQRYSI